MAFIDTIEGLKKALSSYSSDESKLTELYENALKNAVNDNAVAKSQLEEQYRADRHDAVVDTARDERNSAQLLSARGLGFSGEAVQSRLNSGVTLANRLGALANEKNRSAQKLDSDLANRKSEIEFERANKLSSLINERNSLTLQIAKAELEKEEGDADRRAESERLEKELLAEKEKLDKTISAEYERLKAQLDAEQQQLQSKLKSEREQTQMKLDAEQRENAADRDSEKELTAMELANKIALLERELEAKRQENQAERDSEKELTAMELANKIALLERELEAKSRENQADRDADRIIAELELRNELAMLERELELKLNAESKENALDREAEKELTKMELSNKYSMLMRELEAKYADKDDGELPDLGDIDIDVDAEDEKEPFNPSVTPKELAKQLLSSATNGKNSIYSDYHNYFVNKYLLDIIDNYDVDEDYLKSLVLALKSYGYGSYTYDEMKVDVISKESSDEYDKLYKQIYAQLAVEQDLSEKELRTETRELALRYQLVFIEKYSDSEAMFRSICRDAGIADKTVNEYLKNVEWEAPAVTDTKNQIGGRANNATVNQMR